MSQLLAKKSALFLDRDGVINVEKNYVHTVEQFEFIDGIFDLTRSAISAGMEIVVVTNQAGIGRGYYSEAEYETLTHWMCGQFREQGVEIAAVYHCPYHPEHGVGHYRQDSMDRKPNPGMLLRAQRDLDLNLEYSILIGDKDSDIAAAKAAGVGRAVYFSDGPVTFSPAPDMQSHSLKEINRILFAA